MSGADFFFVAGDARPQGSKRAVAPGVLRESAKGLHAWRAKVALTARAAGWMGEPSDAPFAVGLVFVRARPKTHLERDGRVKPHAPPFPIAKPDVDKLERAILDALTGVCWIDDSRVVSVRKMKLFGAREGVGIRVVPVGDVPSGAVDIHDDVTTELLDEILA